MTDYCQNITCLNRGFCRSLFLDCKCECLSNSFSGRHCEEVSTNIFILRTFSKTCGYICVVALSSAAIIVITCDVLKYAFQIDLAHRELRWIKQKRIRRKNQRPVTQKTTHCSSLYLCRSSIIT